ncbi:MAG: HAD family hydrolase [Desulfobacteraceae bacterium 4572_123]|nr:MAG: HAD family hydrolase [Desulfobacteraceae bacterium 4572_123]
MQIKAIMFDLDGTLIDTLEDLSQATNRVLESRGFQPHDIDVYRYFVGDGVKKLIERALPKEQRNETVINACVAEFSKDYGRNSMVKTKPYKGIRELLDKLAARDLKLAILSNKPHDLTVRIVTELLSDWNFSAVLGQRDSIPHKPDPCGALEISHLLDIPPSDFLYVGDSAVDMKTAIAAGMFPVGVLWGFRPMKELQKNGAKALSERPSDIMRIIDDI